MVVMDGLPTHPGRKGPGNFDQQPPQNNLKEKGISPKEESVVPKTSWPQKFLGDNCSPTELSGKTEDLQVRDPERFARPVSY